MSEKAKALLRDAFKKVEEEHQSFAHRVATSLGRSAEHKVRSLGKADAAKLAVTGVAVGSVVIAGALTGGLAIGAVIAIGGAAYAVKKSIERFESYHRNAELRTRWIQLGAEYTNLNAQEQMAKREKLSSVSEADAKDCIRKCIVHMRKAIDHYNTHIKTPSNDAINSCDQAVARAKPLFKFIHEYDKFRSYLLPNLLALQTMLCDYEKMAREWSKNLRIVEQDIARHISVGSHSQCDAAECYHSSAGATAGAARVPTANFDLERMLAQIVPAFDELVSGVAQNKVERRTGAVVHFHGETPQGDTRWQIFRADLTRRYDEPSRGRQVRHFVTNRSMATSKTEKATFAVSQLLDTGSAAGSPFLTGVISSIAKGAVSAGTQLVDVLAGAGIGALSTAAEGADLRNADAILRPGGVPAAPLDSSFKNDDDVKKAFKDDAIAAEKLIVKIGTHWEAGMEALEPINDYSEYLKQHQGTFWSCSQAMNMAVALAEFCHHFSKMEKYLLAYYFVLMRLVAVGKELAQVEAIAYNQIAALRLQVANDTHHSRCDSVCYGPKIITSGVIRKTVQIHKDKVHKPLT